MGLGSAVVCGRFLVSCQKRPTTMSKETYYSLKSAVVCERFLVSCQKRPITVSKETYCSVKSFVVCELFLNTGEGPHACTLDYLSCLSIKLMRDFQITYIERSPHSVIKQVLTFDKVLWSLFKNSWLYKVGFYTLPGSKVSCLRFAAFPGVICDKL